MSLGTTLLAGAGILLGWEKFSQNYYHHRPEPDEVLFARTSDEWRLALSHYIPHPEKTQSHRLPVLLCPGLGSNRTTFDLDPDHSLARFLRDEGYDVFVVELRNSGESDRASVFRGRGYGWTFDDLVKLDAPAAIAAVLQRTGKSQLHWVGHSMGGILLYALATTDHVAQIRSGVTVAASLDYSETNSDFEVLLKAKWLTSIVPAIPLGWMHLMMAPLAGRLRNRLDRFFVWPSNMDAKLYRRLLANNYAAASSPLLEQLATAFESGGLKNIDTQTRYSEQLRQVKLPVLAISGDRDRQCPTSAAQRTIHDIHPDADSKLFEFGRAQGHKDHYGHFDLLIGKNAREEVFPAIAGWLEARSASS